MALCGDAKVIGAVPPPSNTYHLTGLHRSCRQWRHAGRRCDALYYL